MAIEEPGPTRGPWGLLAGYLPFAYVLIAMNLKVVSSWSRLVGANWGTYHDQQRIIQLVALTAVVATLIASSDLRTQLSRTLSSLPRTTRVALGLVLALGALSSVRSVLPSAAFREWGLFALLGVTCLLVATARRRVGPEFDRRAVTITLAGAGIYLVAFVVHDVDPVLTRQSEMYGFSNPSFFGQAALWVFPLLVAAGLRTDGRALTRSGRWLAAVAWWAVLLESGSRSSIYGSLLALVVVAVVFRRQALRWLGAALASIMLGTGVWFLWTSAVVRGRSGLYRAAEKGFEGSGRLDMWGEALDMASRRPLLGLGPEHYAYHATHVHGHPHSAPLQLLVEWGGIATLLVAGLAIWGVASWMTASQRARRAGPPESEAGDLSPALTAALAAGGLASLVDGVVVMPVSQMLMVGVIGLALGRYTPSRPRPPVHRRFGSLATAAIALAAVAVLAMGTLPYATRPAEEVRTYVEGVQGDVVLHPRFWVLGRLDR